MYYLTLWAVAVEDRVLEDGVESVRYENTGIYRGDVLEVDARWLLLSFVVVPSFVRS